MMNMRHVLALMGLMSSVLFLASCGRSPTFSAEQLDQARQALEKCLEAWKRGDNPQSLATGVTPIQFAEEWPSHGWRLKAYEVVDPQFTDTETIRWTVRLTLVDRKGKLEVRQPTYAIVLKSPIVIARDPMY
jgi:ABC-type glycerol-3-phosphate transport system substrate-binding protein